jgi:hypothetical protein
MAISKEFSTLVQISLIPNTPIPLLRELLLKNYPANGE